MLPSAASVARAMQSITSDGSASSGAGVMLDAASGRSTSQCSIPEPSSVCLGNTLPHAAGALSGPEARDSDERQKVRCSEDCYELLH